MVYTHARHAVTGPEFERTCRARVLGHWADQADQGVVIKVDHDGLAWRRSLASGGHSGAPRRCSSAAGERAMRHRGAGLPELGAGAPEPASVDCCWKTDLGGRDGADDWWFNAWAGQMTDQPTEPSAARTSVPGTFPTQLDGASQAAATRADIGMPVTHAVGPAPKIVRYGPGVPAGPRDGTAELTAEHIWHPDRGSRPPKRPAGLVRLAGSLLTVAVLAVAGVLLFERLHHGPFHVTGVTISQQAQAGCGVTVTGRIATNGGAGTVSYQWLFEPGQQSPQRLSQSVASGQHAVDVGIAIDGTGSGSASEKVTLQVLTPDVVTDSAPVVVSCP